jgi:hypothetical protein
MKGRNIMERYDYRLLPKGLRRMLVFSEDFFFREYGKAKAPKKSRREEADPASSSLAFCQCIFQQSIYSLYFNKEQTPGAEWGGAG